MKELHKAFKVYVTYKYFFKRKSGPPKLRGRASEVRWWHKIMPDLWLSFCNTNLELHGQVLMALKLNYHLESLLDQHRGFHALPQLAAQQLKETVFQMLHLQRMVANHFDREEDLPSICSITVKHHMLQHLVLHCHELSPRVVWCVTGEDNMGIMKILCQGCARGWHQRMWQWRWCSTGDLRCIWSLWKSKKVSGCVSACSLGHVLFERFLLREEALLFLLCLRVYCWEEWIWVFVYFMFLDTTQSWCFLVQTCFFNSKFAMFKGLAFTFNFKMFYVQ